MGIAITQSRAARAGRHEARRRSPVIESWKPTRQTRRRDAGRAVHPRTRAPSRRTRDDLESHGKASFRRRMGGSRPALRGGPPCFIQEEDGAVRSPGLKHAPPAHANRCVGLSCLLCSSFSYPPGSRARRARPSPMDRTLGRPTRSHSPFFVPHSNAFPESRNGIDDLPDDPCTELIDRISLTISSRPVRHSQPHSRTHRFLLYSNVFGEERNLHYPRASYSFADAAPHHGI